MRRRRLDAFRRLPHWPGKDPAWQSELADYDYFLMRAAEMLHVAGAEPSQTRPLSAVARAVLEDRLALAGLDVHAPQPRRPTDDDT